MFCVCFLYVCCVFYVCFVCTLFVCRVFYVCTLRVCILCAFVCVLDVCILCVSMYFVRALRVLCILCLRVCVCVPCACVLCVYFMCVLCVYFLCPLCVCVCLPCVCSPSPLPVRVRFWGRGAPPEGPATSDGRFGFGRGAPRAPRGGPRHVDFEHGKTLTLCPSEDPCLKPVVNLVGTEPLSQSICPVDQSLNLSLAPLPTRLSDPLPRVAAVQRGRRWTRVVSRGPGALALELGVGGLPTRAGLRMCVREESG